MPDTGLNKEHPTAEVEAVARALCRVTGADPDALGVDKNPRWLGWAQYAEPAIEAMHSLSTKDRDLVAENERGWRDDMENALLPCDVKLPPATTITKGCKFSTLLTALRNRGFPALPTQNEAQS